MLTYQITASKLGDDDALHQFTLVIFALLSNNEILLSAKG